MTDEQIRAGWRQARQNFAAATERFGRGVHLQAYRARYGEGVAR